MARYILVNRDVYSKVQSSCRPDLPMRGRKVRARYNCRVEDDLYPDLYAGIKRAQPSRPNILDQNINLCCLVVKYEKCCLIGAICPKDPSWPKETNGKPCKTGCTYEFNMQPCRAKCVSRTCSSPNARVYGDVSSNTLEYVGKTRSILIDENFTEEF